MTADPHGRPDWDVIVVGAGPAGAATAASVLMAEPDAKMLVVDRADFPRDKACGDGIAFEVTGALGALGFDVEAVFAGAPPVRRLMLRSPAGVEITRSMSEDVHVIPREIFDDRLVRDLRGRGVEVRRHEVRTVVSDGDAIVLDGVLRAAVVVGADGAESTVRRALRVPRARSGQVALAVRGYAPEVVGQRGAQLIAMGGRDWPAYAWSFPIGNGQANVGYGQLLGARPLNRAAMIDRMAELLPGLDAPASRLRAHRLPLSSGRPAVGPGRIVLVGDAQSLINPLSGEGIFYAVTSGALAGRAAAHALQTGRDTGLTYRRLLRDRLGRHFRQTSAVSRLARWPSLIDAGVRAAATDQRAFDDLVRFGLADGLLTPRLLRRLRFQG